MEMQVIIWNYSSSGAIWFSWWRELTFKGSTRQEVVLWIHAASGETTGWSHNTEEHGSMKGFIENKPPAWKAKELISAWDVNVGKNVSFWKNCNSRLQLQWMLEMMGKSNSWKHIIKRDILHIKQLHKIKQNGENIRNWNENNWLMSWN